MEEENDKLIRGIRKDLDALYQAPEIIRQAKMVYESLPVRSKARTIILEQVRALRKQLIRLDVVCEDIEWSISERYLKKEVDYFNSMKTANNA